MPDYTDYFKALASPDRLRLFTLLSRHAFCVCELEQIVGRSQVNVSRDLKVLKQAGLIRSEKRAQYVIHSLESSTLEQHPALRELLKELSQQEPFLTDFSKARPFMEQSLMTCKIN